jgi:hypothetical protein
MGLCGKLSLEVVVVVDDVEGKEGGKRSRGGQSG